MAEKISSTQILATFFDDGAYTSLFADGAVTAAFGCAGGQTVYAVCQNGDALTVKDAEKNIKVLDMAVQTGNPVVTFYNSIGCKLPEGADVLAVSAKTSAAVAHTSGVVPQIAVVTGVCGASAALTAANADVCIVTEQSQLFFTPPFTSAAQGDKVADAGTAKAAQKAGVAALVVKDAAEAVEKASQLVAMLPANNLSSPAVFQFEEPAAAFNMAAYKPVEAVEALADKGSVIPLYEGYGERVYTALATVGGNAVGFLATAKEDLCAQCTSKAARFVRLCDAFSIPVVTIVNTEGFCKSTSEDIAGGLRSAARLAATMADATTVKVAILAGKVIGAVYSAFADADIRIAVQGCTIAAVEPAVAVSVLNRKEIEASENIIAATNAAAARYEAEVCSANASVAAGTADMAAEPAALRGTLVAVLDMLATKRAQRLPKKHGNMAL